MSNHLERAGRAPHVSPERSTARTRKPAAKRKRFTPAIIEQRAPAKERVEYRDDLSPLWLRITPAGERKFAVRARIKGQKQPIRLTYPESAHVSNLAAARVWAVKVDGQCRAGVDPREAQRVARAADAQAADQAHRSAFEKVVEAFLATDGVHKKNGRPWKPATRAEYERIFASRLVPRWRGRAIQSITRDEIADVLAGLAETAPIAANRALATLSSMMSWYQKQRGSGFTSPIVRGMAPAEERTRDRILSDDELRVVWSVARRTGTFGAIVRALLLTAARRNEVGAMRRSQIGRDGIWALNGARTKNHLPLYLPLSTDALELIAAQPQTDNQDLVFSIGGSAEFRNWGHSKADFDKRVFRRLRAQARAAGQDPREVQPLDNWHLHDLRRTARSLMARAGVPDEHAERVLNHKIGGVKGTYNRHSYENEKREALVRLADMLNRIAGGQSAHVVQFPLRDVAA